MPSTQFVRVNWRLTRFTEENALNNWGGAIDGGKFVTRFSDDCSIPWRLMWYSDMFHHAQLHFAMDESELDEDANFPLMLNAYGRIGDKFLALEGATNWNEYAARNGGPEYPRYKVIEWDMIQMDELLQLANQKDHLDLELVINVRNQLNPVQERSLAAQSTSSLLAQVSPDNCLQLYDFAVRQRVDLLADKCFSLILLNFNQLRASEKFRKLPLLIQKRIIDKVLDTPQMKSETCLNVRRLDARDYFEEGNCFVVRAN